MQLWTDYEGITVAGNFRLEKLLRSEGRNAFFSSTDPSGAPITVRLTEALNDEGELMTRWQKVAAVPQENLLRIASAGKTVVDGVPLAYLLIEPADGALADVLIERPLTTQETVEVASAVADALAALHAAGLIHEHVAADNVMAVGETIKLRTDCVRECVGDFENDTEAAREALRARDTHDLGRLLFRCITLQREPGERIAPGTLPAPFDRIVPNALSGAWDIKAIQNALPVKKPVASAVPPPSAVAVPPAVAASAKTADPQIALPLQSVPASASSCVPAVKSGFRPRGAKSTPPLQVSAKAPATSAEPPVPAAAAPSTRRDGEAYPGSRSIPYEAGLADMSAHRATLEQELVTRLHGITESRVFAGVGTRFGATMERPALRYGFGAAAVVLLGVMIHHWAETPDPVVTAAPIKATAPVAATAPTPPPAPSMAGSLLTAARSQPGWHVIAYTYNHEEQARAKVMALQRQHFSLQPQVFTPTGGAPYFVALGTPGGEDEAVNIRSRARRAGLPRDTYIRNF